MFFKEFGEKCVSMGGYVGTGTKQAKTGTSCGRPHESSLSSKVKAVDLDWSNKSI